MQQQYTQSTHLRGEDLCLARASLRLTRTSLERRRVCRRCRSSRRATALQTQRFKRRGEPLSRRKLIQRLLVEPFSARVVELVQGEEAPPIARDEGERSADVVHLQGKRIKGKKRDENRNEQTRKQTTKQTFQRLRKRMNTQQQKSTPTKTPQHHVPPRPRAATVARGA